MMLAEEASIEDLDKEKVFILQPKLDGIRAMLTITKDKRITLLGRHNNGQSIACRYPELMADAEIIARNIDEEITLDGEIVISTEIDAFFQRCRFDLIAGREHVQSPQRIKLLARMMPVKFYVFDIITAETTTMPLRERTRVLTSLLNSLNLSRIKPIPSIEGNASLIANLLAKAKETQQEGIMAKCPSSLYEHRRSPSWKKIKCFTTKDLKIIGFISKNRTISSLMLEDGSHVNAILDDYWHDYILNQESVKREASDGMQYLFAKPSLICVVKYLPTEGNKHLRFPQIAEIRKEEVVLEC